MTAKEQLRVILKRGAYWTTLEDQDNALTLLDQIDDRAGKMREDGGIYKTKATIR